MVLNKPEMAIGVFSGVASTSASIIAFWFGSRGSASEPSRPAVRRLGNRELPSHDHHKATSPGTKVARLKDELRSGELSLAEFAADLHEVTLGQGKRPVYEDPARFFALTYPTHALRELVKDVAERLAGKSAKAVRQLELTYGGGKTHTLITLYHLFRDPAALSGVTAVQEFRQHVGADLPEAFPVPLCFDKIDVERGIDGVRAPDGETRTLKHPWSVLAFQLAGADGLRAIHAERRGQGTRDAARRTVARVQSVGHPVGTQGLGTLILIDEVLMYARGKAGMDRVWRERIVDFFQHLVQAVSKVDRAALVASLLASDPNKHDNLGDDLCSPNSSMSSDARRTRRRPTGRQGRSGRGAAPPPLRCGQPSRLSRAGPRK